LLGSCSARNCGVSVAGCEGVQMKDKKKFTFGMAIGVAAGMVLYRILFG
jgi:hypothetical protein